jgi:tetratricopeptide (TPR) repeat protein
VEAGFHDNGAVADWAEHLRREEERYRDGESRLPDAEDADARQRQLTRMGNAAAGAGLALVMQGRTGEAREWFDRACERYRESWTDAPPGSWGRPIAILKARILAGDWDGAESDARWTLEQGADKAESPIGQYAAALAYAALGKWDEARIAADALRLDERFPDDVADALAYVASPDPVAYVEAVESVLQSFETRDGYLEDLPAADTVLVLQSLAERRGVAPAKLESALLP